MKKALFNIFFVLSFFSFLYGQNQELIVKAAYLEKFAMFTEWPGDVLKNKSEPFVIYVYGAEEYFDVIKIFYSDHKVREREVKVEHITRPEEISGCHILFISDVSSTQLKNVLKVTQNSPILTVSDTEGFASKGVLINLFKVENKVRFEINESSIKPSGLVLSYHLLKFAKIVDPSDN